MTVITRESADMIVSRLARACELAGVEALPLEPSTRLRVSRPARRTEVITLRPDADEVLCWWWPSGEQVCPAGDPKRAARLISQALSAAGH